MTTDTDKAIIPLITRDGRGAPPIRIESLEDYEAALVRVEKLMDATDAPEVVELDLLADAVEAFEEDLIEEILAHEPK